MSQVIRVTDELYKRLEAHASGFVTPSDVIERILDAYEGIAPNSSSTREIGRKMERSDHLEIAYHSGTEEGFNK